jgi:hypothetical protein
VTCFLTTGLDALVVGDHLVRKEPRAAGAMPYRHLSPSLPASRKLVMRTGPAGAREYALESTSSRWFGEKEVSVSPDAFAVLLASDGARTLDELLHGREGMDDARRRGVLEEMEELWSRRVVSLRPPRVPAETAAGAAPRLDVPLAAVVR